MATTNLTDVNKRPIAQNPVFQQAYQDAIVNKAYAIFLIGNGDPLYDWALSVLRGGSAGGYQNVRSWIDPIPGSVSVDPDDYADSFNFHITRGELDDYLPILAGTA